MVRLDVPRPPFSRPEVELKDGTINLAIGHPIRDDGNTRTVQRDTVVTLNESFLRSHVAIFGGTRMGKSKLLEMLMRDLTTSNKAGYCLVDPHGDLCDEMLGYIGQNWTRLPAWKRNNIYYLNPSEQPFCFDCFDYEEPEDTGHWSSEAYYRHWLEAAVDRTADVVLRQQGEYSFKGTPNLEKYLKSVLYATGVRLDPQGTHLPFAFAPILVMPRHERYKEVFARISPALPSYQRSMLAELRDMPPHERLGLAGSTENRLVTMLKSIVKDTFSNLAEPINLRRIVRQNGIILCNLADTEIFTQKPADAIGGLLISQLINIARSTPERKRQPFYVIIDEAHRFVGRDVMNTLGQSSKWMLFFMLAVQGLSRLRNEEEKVDMLPDVLSNCNVKITFRQQDIEDAERLARNLCYRDLDFTKLVHKQQFHSEYLWWKSKSITDAESWEEGHSWADIDSWSKAEQQSVSDGSTETDTIAKNWSQAKMTGRAVASIDQEQVSSSESVGGSSTEGDSHASAHSDVRGGAEARAETDGKSRSTSSSFGEGMGDILPPTVAGSSLIYNPGDSFTTHSGRSRGEADSESTTRAVIASAAEVDGTTTVTNRSQTRDRHITKGGARTTGTNITETQQHQVSSGGSESHATGTMHTVTIGQSEGTGGSQQKGGSDSKGGSKSTTRGWIPLAEFRVEEVDTGNLVEAVDDQLAKKTKLINTLHRAQAVLLTNQSESSIPVEIAYVRDTFDGYHEMWKAIQIAHTKNLIYASHACYIHTEDSFADPAFEDAVLDAWLAGQARPDTPPAPLEDSLEYEPPFSPAGFPSEF